VVLTWCASQGSRDPLQLGRAEIERYVRWLQEVCRYRPWPASRRLSVVVGFYRVYVTGPAPGALAGRLRAPTTDARRITALSGMALHFDLDSIVRRVELSVPGRAGHADLRQRGGDRRRSAFRLPAAGDEKPAPVGAGDPAPRGQMAPGGPRHAWDFGLHIRRPHATAGGCYGGPTAAGLASTRGPSRHPTERTRAARLVSSACQVEETGPLRVTGAFWPRVGPSLQSRWQCLASFGDHTWR